LFLLQREFFRPLAPAMLAEEVKAMRAPKKRQGGALSDKSYIFLFFLQREFFRPLVPAVLAEEAGDLG